jgi:hypothetical protein
MTQSPTETQLYILQIISLKFMSSKEQSIEKKMKTWWTLIQHKQNETEQTFNFPEITILHNTEVISYLSNRLSKSRNDTLWCRERIPCGNFFKMVRKKITGTRFTAGLQAMNDLSSSPSGIDCHLRWTSHDCWWRCVCLATARLVCNIPPASCPRPPVKAYLTQSSSAASSVHIWRASSQLHPCFPFPTNLLKQNSPWRHAPPSKYQRTFI